MRSDILAIWIEHYTLTAELHTLYAEQRDADSMPDLARRHRFHAQDAWAKRAALLSHQTLSQARSPNPRAA